MTRFAVALVFMLLPSDVFADTHHFGHYVGKVRAEWLVDGRRMRLLEDFSYVDPSGVKWRAPSGSVVDGASIPKFAWSIIGGPFEGKYRRASVIHDVACERRARPWEIVHEAFYWAMRAASVETAVAKTMYAAVYYFGPRWSRTVEIQEVDPEAEPFARNQALSNAAPGSKAEVIEMRPTLTGQVNFTVRISPPGKRLSQNEFDEIKRMIAKREKPEQDPMSLEEIRKYSAPQ